jgi:uncharacterized protein GlcG (DUF336 family)
MRVQKGWCAVFASALLGACGGGGAAVSSVGASVAPAGSDCTGNCANAGTFLTVADVQTIISQGIAEATARNALATIAVVDRVGNVLAVYRMGAAANRPVIVGSEFDASGNALLHSGLEGVKFPNPKFPSANIDHLAAISKAVTGAYLSSEGNAFSTRTASQIIQEHFNPGVNNAPSGPLFGVQFSQLACSDFLLPAGISAATPGPQSAPLGLAADPGGFPLYKGGTVVGGVGVIADGVYSLDKNIDDIVVGTDEAIAFAASYGYAAPVDRRADQITAGGVTLRFSDVAASDLISNPAAAPVFTSLTGVGSLVAVPGYADGQVHAGVAFGQPGSGIIPDGGASFPGLDAYVFADARDVPRFPAIAGTDGASALTQAEVHQILVSALGVAGQARAQIRLPVGMTASVTISVVDTNGAILGMVRTQDAPVFGADVSLQKARTAAFFSSSGAGAYLQSLPHANYVNISATAVTLTPVSLAQYLPTSQAFLADTSAFTDGHIAYSDRAIGDLSRPFFPDGIDGAANGPFSKPAGHWSIFSTGLQLDLSINAILEDALAGAGIIPTGDLTYPANPGCAGVSLSLSPALAVAQTLPASDVKKLANGLQIFPGSVPIYRGATLVGAVGVSGDGVDQDDMIAFLGLERASLALNGSIGQAPAARRADTLTPRGTRLVYVQCPQSPFVNSDQENVCAGF